MQHQHEYLIKLDRQFVSFEMEEVHRSFLDGFGKDIISSTSSSLSEIISTSLKYLQSVNGADKLLLRNQLACASTKKWFSGGCKFMAAYIAYQLGLAVDFSEDVAFTSLHQPELFVRDITKGQLQLFGRMKGVFGSSRPKIIILPYCEFFDGKADALVIEIPFDTTHVTDAPLVFLDLIIENANILCQKKIVDVNAYIFDLLSLQCSLLLGLINEASKAALIMP